MGILGLNEATYFLDTKSSMDVEVTSAVSEGSLFGDILYC